MLHSCRYPYCKQKTNPTHYQCRLQCSFILHAVYFVTLHPIRLMTANDATLVPQSMRPLRSWDAPSLPAWRGVLVLRPLLFGAFRRLLPGINVYWKIKFSTHWTNGSEDICKFLRNTYLRFPIICLTISFGIRQIMSQNVWLVSDTLRRLKY